MIVLPRFLVGVRYDKRGIRYRHFVVSGASTRGVVCQLYDVDGQAVVDMRYESKSVNTARRMWIGCRKLFKCRRVEL